MSDNRPKWPDSFPPPIEFTEGERCVYFMAADFQNISTFENLIYDLYWFPGDNYYLFFKHGEKLSQNLLDEFERNGILLIKTELYFYRHPNPAFVNDFVRLLPGELKYDWQIEAAQGEMYGRTTISLEDWKKKEFDVKNIANVIASKIEENQPILEIKPGWCGINLNLRRLVRKIIVNFKNRKNASCSKR
jgi:hypothetical protein